jgi:AraC-like DNA-binding protein
VPLELKPGTSKNRYIKMDTAFGSGGIHFCHLNRGIILTIMDCTLNEPVSAQYTPPFESLSFGFSLSGCMEIRPEDNNRALTLKSGQSDLNLVPGGASHMEILGLGRLTRVCLTMDHGVLNGLTGPDHCPLPTLLQQRPCSLLHYKGNMTPSMRTAIAQIMNCPYQGATREMFLEGKVLELIAHKLDQLGSPLSGQKPVINARDNERVRHAAQLLIRDLDIAPNLVQLARTVGMCRTILHECFLKVHGMTPFEYLQHHRLETAMGHLVEGRMNVTQAAFAVGYSSSGYFSKVFKRRYGNTPKKFMPHR